MSPCGPAGALFAITTLRISRHKGFALADLWQESALPCQLKSRQTRNVSSPIPLIQALYDLMHTRRTRLKSPIRRCDANGIRPALSRHGLLRRTGFPARRTFRRAGKPAPQHALPECANARQCSRGARQRPARQLPSLPSASGRGQGEGDLQSIHQFEKERRSTWFWSSRHLGLYHLSTTRSSRPIHFLAIVPFGPAETFHPPRPPVPPDPACDTPSGARQRGLRTRPANAES